MALPAGRARVEARLTLPKKSSQSRIIWMLISMIAVAAAARVVARVGDIKITSPATEIATDRNRLVLTGTVDALSLPSKVQIAVNQQTHDVVLDEAAFYVSDLPLQPGENIVCAFLSQDSWDAVKVVSPREFFHFDDDEEGWTLSSTAGYQPKLMKVSDQKTGGHLAAERGEERLDLIFLVDASASMKVGETDWKRLIQSVLSHMGQRFPGMRVGLATYRGDELQYVQRLGEGLANLPDGICKLAGGSVELTENLLPSLRQVIAEVPTSSTSEWPTQLITITDSPSKSDSDDLHAEIAALARQRQTEIHAVIVESRLPDVEQEEEIAKQEEVNRVLSQLALACGQKLADSNNGVCIEFLIPPKFVFPPGSLLQPEEMRRNESMKAQLALEAEKEFNGQLSRIVDRIESNLQAFQDEADGKAAQWSLRPPRRCLESLRKAYGENIFVSLHGSQNPTICLQCENEVLTLELEADAKAWSTFKIPLNESAPWISETGTVPNLERVLVSLSDFEIRSERPVKYLMADRFLITQADQIDPQNTAPLLEKENRDVK